MGPADGARRRASSDLDAIYPYADPLGALNLAVMGDGEQLQWHFDQTDFVVSLALQDAEVGGDFEVAPQIRTADDERYDDVARVLGGGARRGRDAADDARHAAGVRRPVLDAPREPDRGSTPRLVALLGYDTKPGTMSSELLKEVRYGRRIA